jgi:hypothetical protein
MKNLLFVFFVALAGCQHAESYSAPTDDCLNHCRIWQHEFVAHNNRFPVEYCCEICDGEQIENDEWVCAMVNSQNGGSIWDCLE